MTVDFGIRLTRRGRGSTQETLEYYEYTLNSLSQEITTVWIDDHLQYSEGPSLESWVLMAYLAGLYPRFKYGHMVIAQGFRNPALLAKMGASLQHLTGGRFIMGLGAGWDKAEFDAYNVPFPAPRVRVEQLAETIAILRAMWTQSPATYHGKHYTIENANSLPLPDPVPPIMVGTNGKRALGVTARLADGWNWDFAMSAFVPPYQTLREECAAIGRDVGEIWLTLGGSAHFPEDPADFEATDPTAAATVVDGYVVPQEPKLGPTPADAIEQLRPFIEYGVRHFQIGFDDQRTIDLFCREVAPVLAHL